MTLAAARKTICLLAAVILACQATFCAGLCRMEIPARQCQALSGLATMTLPPPDATDAVLDSLGYGMEKRPGNWAELAPLRRWEVAWISAQHGTPPSGGSRFIGEAVTYFSQRYESASIIVGSVARPSLGSLLQPLTFATFRPSSEVIPEQASHMLKLLAEYSGGLGGIYGVLMDGLGLTESEASEAVQDSASREDALVLGLAKLPASVREQRIRQIVALIDKRYPQTAFEHGEFDAFRVKPPERLRDTTGGRKVIVESEHDAWNEWKEFLIKGLRHRL